MRTAKVVVRPQEIDPEPDPLHATYEYSFMTGATTTTTVDRRSVSMLGTIKELAPMLWSGDYATLFEQERQELEAKCGLMTAGSLLKGLVKPSQYKRKGRGSNKSKAKRQHQEETDKGMMASAAWRQANQRNCTFSCCARSVNAMMKRLPHKEWVRQQKRKEIYSRKWTYLIVDGMMACAPAPDVLTSSALQGYIIDQKYIKKGKSRGQHRAAERVDASGDLIELVSFVFVNVMKIPIPYSLAPLTPEEILLLQEKGPYTRPPARIKLVLDPTAVKASLAELFIESMGFVKQVMARSGIKSPTDLNIPLIARSQCGRPNIISAGATHWSLGAPVLGDDEKGCDTKSKKDLLHIKQRLREMHDPPCQNSQNLAWAIHRLPQAMQDSMSVPCAATMNIGVTIVTGDGQTGISICSEKVR